MTAVQLIESGRDGDIPQPLHSLVNLRKCQLLKHINIKMC
jgi:hypothetical protein